MKILKTLQNGSLLDKSGNGNDGTLTAGNGGFKYTERGQAMLFDGADTKIDTGSDFIGTSACTIRAWIKPYSYGEGNFGRIIDNVNTSLFLVNANRRVSFTSNGGTSAANGADDSISLNVWQRVCITRTSDGTTNLYVNGRQTGTANQNSGTPTAVGNSNVIIGNILFVS